MNTEELLRPRYKVIANYPDSNYTIGNILDRNWCRYENDDEEAGKVIWQLSDFPHLFKKLEWWEERPIDEMPEYVKIIREDCVIDTGLYCKVFRWTVFDDKIPTITGQYAAELEGYSPLYLARTELNFPGQVYGRLNATHLQPATLAEYETYINQKEKQ